MSDDPYYAKAARLVHARIARRQATAPPASPPPNPRPVDAKPDPIDVEARCVDIAKRFPLTLEYLAKH